MKLLVDLPSRYAKQRAHTATHLVHYMLDQLLGGTKQAGSLVDSDYLRFDFAAKEPLTQAQITTIENELSAWIMQDVPVTITEMSLEEAKNTGAKAFFEDKYGDIVRVIHIPTTHETMYAGNSTEFCGGTHVSSTGMIGACKIINQEAVASGIRRIEAVTWPRVTAYAQQKEHEQYAYAQLLDCSPKQLAEKIQKLLSSQHHLQQENDHLQQILIKQCLTTATPRSSQDFAYLLDIATLQLTHIPLKQIALCARTCRPSANWILYSSDGQFALCADKTNNAKELQQRLWIKGGGDNQLVQGKDTSIVEIISTLH